MIRIDQTTTVSPHRSRKQRPIQSLGDSKRFGTSMTAAEAIDEKLKAALLRARTLIFRSPVWPVEFEADES